MAKSRMMGAPITVTPDVSPPEIADVRTRILFAAAQLIASGGTDAATTRAIASAAAAQAPTIYRIFGDKRGLLLAVVEHSLAAYVAAKSRREVNVDPVQDLREGWDLHVEFGLAHPALLAIMSSDPHLHLLSPTIMAGREALKQRIKRIALAGRLRMSESRAVALLDSMSVGTILSLLSQPPGQRDAGLADAAREAVMSAITGEAMSPTTFGPSIAAAALSAVLDQTPVLTPGEKHFLAELLARVANGPTPLESLVVPQRSKRLNKNQRKTKARKL